MRRSTLMRLRRLSRAEIADRARQSARIAVERWSGAFGREMSDRSLRHRLRGGTPAAVLSRMRSPGGSWFIAAGDSSMATRGALDRLCPGATGRLMDHARRLAAGRFDLLGYRGLDFGSPIDWHLDPLRARRAPLVHWSRVPYLDADRVGDHKLIWELNRHHHLVTLAQAFRIGGDEYFAGAALDQLDAWIAANPPETGINWASSLELSFRSIAWTWLLHLVADSEALDEARLARALKSLYRHGRHIERYLSTYFSPNTHLTGEALGLLYLGSCFPEFDRAAVWRDMGWRVLLQESERQIMSDGTYFEQTSWYARYTADFLLHALVLDAPSGGERSLPLRGHLAGLLRYLAALTRPDGTTPLIGDDDGGRLLPLSGPPSDDFRATLAVGAALLGADDLAHVAGGVLEEAVWLAGGEAAGREARRPAHAPSAGVTRFPQGGSLVIRDRWSREGAHAVLDAGPQGTLTRAHAHADALTIELSIAGRPLFVDPGTYTYSGSAPERDRLRSAAAHSSVTFDGVPSATPAGPFAWSRTEDAVWRAALSGARFAYVSGSREVIDGRTVVVRHARALLHLTSDYWLVHDRIEASSVRDCTIRFQLASDLTVETTSEEDTVAVVVESAGEPVARLYGLGANRAEVHDAPISPCYGRLESASAVTFERRGSGAFDVVTAVVPAALGAVEVTTLEGIHAGWRLDGNVWSDLLLLGDGTVRVSASGVVSRAELTWVRRPRGSGRPTEVLVIGARELEIDGRCVLATPADAFEVRLSEAEAWRTAPVAADRVTSSPARR